MMPKFSALLIGVDGYLPNRLSDGSSYPQLSGCVRDIARVEEFFRQTLRVAPDRIQQLTASRRVGRADPPEPRERWPTYENMAAAFRRLTEDSHAGDQVYIHYSGHGGRVPTLFPEHKDPAGLDECLVPVDIGNSSARYFRDVELAQVLHDMVAQELVVTIVLDCCHSGGATRGAADAAVRGLGTVDTTSRPRGSLVATDDVLAQTWRILTASTPRDVAFGSGWLSRTARLYPAGRVVFGSQRAASRRTPSPCCGWIRQCGCS